MTIDEAISHALEVAERYERMEDSHDDKLKEECLQCAADHRQLAEWLMELQELSLQIEAPKLGSIEDYHYELAKCKAAFWSCNRRCMNAEEQYRRKADELRKAQEQIAEYKRLLKAAVDDFKEINSDILTCKYCRWYSVEIDECTYYPDDVPCKQICGWKHEAEALKLLRGSENG